MSLAPPPHEVCADQLATATGHARGSGARGGTITSSQIVALTRRLHDHPLYRAVTTRHALRVFVEHHVFAVWDFMSLLKSLQASLTCVQVPWVPAPSGSISRLINEIVLGEESDVMPDGSHASHFEIYLAAMRELGANTLPIDTFVARLRQGSAVIPALHEASAPLAAVRFVETTFDILAAGRPHATAAAFACGREDLVPQMFQRVASHTSTLRDTHPAFHYYLDRHILIDTESHGPMAREMLMRLCGDNRQHIREATEAVERSLLARVALWDGAYDAIIQC